MQGDVRERGPVEAGRLPISGNEAHTVQGKSRCAVGARSYLRDAANLLSPRWSLASRHGLPPSSALRLRETRCHALESSRNDHRPPRRVRRWAVTDVATPFDRLGAHVLEVASDPWTLAALGVGGA